MLAREAIVATGASPVDLAGNPHRRTGESGRVYRLSAKSSTWTISGDAGRVTRTAASEDADDRGLESDEQSF